MNNKRHVKVDIFIVIMSILFLALAWEEFQAINDNIVGMEMARRTKKNAKNNRGLTLYRDNIFLQSESLGLLAK